MNIGKTDKDVLMLAGMVNSSLNHVDRMMEERSGIAGPINKLNLQALLREGQTPSNINQQNYGISEEIVRSMVPDTSSPYIPQPTPIETPPQPASLKISNVDPSKIEQDIASIKNLLERINGNLTKMSGMIGKVFCAFNEKTKNSE